MDGQYCPVGTDPQVTDDALTKFQRLCALADVPEVGAHAAEASVDGVVEPLIVLRRGNDVRAFLNICPHAGRRLDWAPGEFLIDGELLVCASHGAGFTLPDGVCVAGPCRGQSLTALAVRIVDDDVVTA